MTNTSPSPSHLHGIGNCVGKTLTKSEWLHKRQLELWHVGGVLYVAKVPGGDVGGSL